MRLSDSMQKHKKYSMQDILQQKLIVDNQNYPNEKCRHKTSSKCHSTINKAAKKSLQVKSEMQGFYHSEIKN